MVCTPITRTPRTRFFYRACDASDQAAASDRHHYRIQIGNLLQYFQTDGPLPCDHAVVVEAVHEDEPLIPFAPAGLLQSFIEVTSVEDHFRTPGLGGRNLHQRRELGHADFGANPAARGVVRHSLRMIAGRGRDHATGALHFCQEEKAIQRSTFLERSRDVQGFELEE